MSSGLACLPDFTLTGAQIASGPPEALGRPRDGVRLMVAAPERPVQHRQARDLPAVLRAGDLVVLNTSDTLPAALGGVTAEGDRVQVHLSTVLPGSGMAPAAALAATRSVWVVEFRTPAPPASTQTDADRSGVDVHLRGGGRLTVIGSHPSGRSRSRLWVGELNTPAPLRAWLSEHGAPVRYDYVSSPWPLSSYRTTYADTPGSAEMPSAGRALTGRLLRRLRARGVRLADVVLHCGLSSVEGGDPPYAEWFSVPESTVAAVTETKAAGGRVIAVGTTVVRALESVQESGGRLRATDGWTDLVITPSRGVSTVDGLLTGWHEPQASHLQMLEALAGPDLLCTSYQEALANGYRWHEFGDLHLILPG